MGSPGRNVTIASVVASASFAIGVLVSMATDGTDGADTIGGAGEVAGFVAVFLVLFLLRRRLWQRRRTGSADRISNQESH
jgi:hypothetical protein